MGRRRTIPVRVIQSGEKDNLGAAEAMKAALSQGDDAVRVAAARTQPGEPRRDALAEEPVQKSGLSSNASQLGESEAVSGSDVARDMEQWRDQALRLQADMDNYRKRQRRLAEDEIEAERQRLYRAFLRVVDNLERALEAPDGDNESLRKGVKMIHQEALQLLEKEGVERVQAAHQPFDPNWHEAVATVSSGGAHVAPNTVVQVTEAGYRLGDRLLRPARVVVAV